MSTTNRRGNLENSSFRLVGPESGSINLILSGAVISSGSEEEGYSVDTASIRGTVYTVQGIGFLLEPYRDTLRDCTEVWIPIRDSIGVVHEVRFEVSSRTTYRNWVYLWSTGSSALVPGSWIVDGFTLGEDPYFSGSVGQELDYSCPVSSADRSVIFVEYVPTGFEFAGEYNALLNNAQSESTRRNFYVSSSIRIKKFVIDNHKNPGIGGIHAGLLHVDAGTDKKTVQRYQYVQQFISRSESSGSSYSLQTLDLAFTSYRAISASIYVDREKYSESVPIENVWKDLQENNTDDPELVYFTPRSVLDLPDGCVVNPWWLAGEVRLDGARTTVPAVGHIMFKMDGHTPVRHTHATIYSPFINTVYRTDDYGIVTEAFSASVGS